MVVEMIVGVVLAFVCVMLLKSVYLVQQAEAVVIERLGRYDRTLTAGIHIVIPFIERPHRVSWSYTFSDEDGDYYQQHVSTFRIDMRELVYDFPKQRVITKDNVMMEVNALLYYHVTDPKRAVYEVYNMPEAIEKLTQTTLRNVIGSLDLDESLVSRDAINEKLRVILDDASDKWGVKVTRVELQEVNPPDDIRIAMEKQMRAERDRRAVILESEGEKQSAILRAQGEQEAMILRAQGQAQARVINAEADAEARLKTAKAEAGAIEFIKEAAPKQDPLSYLAAVQYIKTIPHLMEGKDNKVIVVPYEAAGLSGSIGSIKQILKQLD